MGQGGEGLGVYGRGRDGAGVCGGLLFVGLLGQCEGCGCSWVGGVGACGCRGGGFGAGIREALFVFPRTSFV